MVLFDLDHTLVDTDPFRAYHDSGSLLRAAGRITNLGAYDGIGELLQELDRRAVPIGVVSNSPKAWALVFVKYYGWPVEVVVGGNSHENDKPGPEPIQQGIELCKATGSECFFVGDKRDDVEAARAAGLRALGAAWGIPDDSALREAGADEVFHSVADLSAYLLDRIPPIQTPGTERG